MCIRTLCLLSAYKISLINGLMLDDQKSFLFLIYDRKELFYKTRSMLFHRQLQMIVET